MSREVVLSKTNIKRAFRTLNKTSFYVRRRRLFLFKRELGWEGEGERVAGCARAFDSFSAITATSFDRVSVNRITKFNLCREERDEQQPRTCGGHRRHFIALRKNPSNDGGILRPLISFASLPHRECFVSTSRCRFKVPQANFCCERALETSIRGIHLGIRKLHIFVRLDRINCKIRVISVLLI